MSAYDKETKFYWLQLKEDFFEDDAIEWLEEQQPNGRDYAYFYLKLCLKSLKTNGILIRAVGNILIPYDNKKLAELTKMDFDTVCVAMELLKQIGLIKILENGEIYMTQLENLIGSVSKGALKKQQQRLLSGQKEDKCPPKIKIEIKDKVKDKDKIKNKYGEYKHVLLTEKEYETLKKDYDNCDDLITYLDEYIEMKGYKAKSHYLCIKKWVVDAVKQHKKNEPEWFNQTFEKQRSLTKEEMEAFDNEFKGSN